MPLIAITIVILAVIGVIILLKTPNEKRKVDYRAYYTMGLIWLPVGIVFWIVLDNIAFLGLGVVFLSIGLANKDKWGKTAKSRKKKK